MLQRPRVDGNVLPNVDIRSRSGGFSVWSFVILMLFPVGTFQKRIRNYTPLGCKRSFLAPRKVRGEGGGFVYEGETAFGQSGSINEHRPRNFSDRKSGPASILHRDRLVCFPIFVACDKSAVPRS